MPKISNRLDLVPPYLFEEIDRKKRLAIAKGVDIINLGIGDPDQPTYSYIVKAMQEAVAKPVHHDYPSSSGEDFYRQAVANWYQEKFAVSLDPATEITALIGSKEGLAHLSLAYLDSEDIALVPDPSYPVYKMWTLMAGAEPYLMPLNKNNHFLPDYSLIPASVLKRAKLLYLNYPNNPTGAIASESFLKESIEFAKKNDLLLVYDNAYCDMTYDGYIAPSILQFAGAKELCLEFTSLSKSFNMTGWRIGSASGNSEAIKALRVIKSNADSGQFKAIQEASALALKKQLGISEQNQLYQERRDVLYQGLKSLGSDLDAPLATFYFWVKVPIGYNANSFAGLLLDECGIITVPGTGYGDAGEGFIRMALTVSKERLVEAIKRMQSAGIKF